MNNAFLNIWTQVSKKQQARLLAVIYKYMINNIFVLSVQYDGYNCINLNILYRNILDRVRRCHLIELSL